MHLAKIDTRDEGAKGSVCVTVRRVVDDASVKEQRSRASDRRRGLTGANDEDEDRKGEEDTDTVPDTRAVCLLIGTNIQIRVQGDIETDISRRIYPVPYKYNRTEPLSKPARAARKLIPDIP